VFSELFLSVTAMSDLLLVGFNEGMRNYDPAIVQFNNKYWISFTQDSHWTQLIPNSKGSNRRPLSDGFNNLSSHETKRREALWELFHSEVVYLIDHLLVLSEVFLNPLEILQQMGHLPGIQKFRIFCNLKGLCEVYPL